MSWDFLNDCNVRVFCISLRERDDRYQASRAELARAGLLNHVTYYRPTRHWRGGRVGCWDSHRHIIDKKLDSHLLIFEDDVVFTAGWSAQLQAIQGFLVESARGARLWDLFYLGALIHRVFEEDELSYKVEASATHAYFIHKDYAAHLRNNPFFCPLNYRNLPVDHYYRLYAACYILKTPICYQRSHKRVDAAWKDSTFEKRVQGYVFDYGIQLNNWLAPRAGWLHPMNLFWWMVDTFAWYT